MSNPRVISAEEQEQMQRFREKKFIEDVNNPDMLMRAKQTMANEQIAVQSEEQRLRKLIASGRAERLNQKAASAPISAKESVAKSRYSLFGGIGKLLRGERGEKKSTPKPPGPGTKFGK